MMEYEAAAGLCDWLTGHGFRVELGAYGLPTAFVATYGLEAAPAIWFLAEYDALPGQGNTATPYRAPDGKPAGHACGHNQIGPANVGAAIAARYAIEQLGLRARLVVVGCPAEEIIWGKIALLREGAFAGIDALLTSHGDYQNGSLARPCLAGFSGEFVFSGVSSHGGSPRKSNALEAVELTVQSFERLRAHQFAEVSLEHVLRVAGLMPSITPEQARLWVTSRHVDYDRAGEAYRYVVRVARSAAEFTETSFREQFIAATRGYLPNDVLAQAIFRSMEIVGPPRWLADDVQWMEQLAGECGIAGSFALDRGTDVYTEGVDPYCQDDGEVSWHIPLGLANWAIPHQVLLHSWSTTALVGHRASYPGPLMVSEALALAAIDLVVQPHLLAEAAQELAARRGDLALSAPLLGGFEVLTKTPGEFWDATWVTTEGA